MSRTNASLHSGIINLSNDKLITNLVHSEDTERLDDVTKQSSNSRISS